MRVPLSLDSVHRRRGCTRSMYLIDPPLAVHMDSEVENQVVTPNRPQTVTDHKPGIEVVEIGKVGKVVDSEGSIEAAGSPWQRCMVAHTAFGFLHRLVDSDSQHCSVRMSCSPSANRSSYQRDCSTW